MFSTPKTGILKPKNSAKTVPKAQSPPSKGKENIATKLMKPTASWLEKTRSKFIKASTESLTSNNDRSLARSKTSTNFQRNNILRKTTNTPLKTPISTKPPPKQQRSHSFNKSQQRRVDSDEDSGINTPRSPTTPLSGVPPLVNIAVVENHLEYLLKQVQETEKTVRYYNKAVVEEATEENQYLVNQLVKKNEEIEGLHRQIDELKFKLHHAEAAFSPNRALLENETCPSFVQNGDGLIKLFEVVEQLQEEFIGNNISEKSFLS